MGENDYRATKEYKYILSQKDKNESSVGELKRKKLLTEILDDKGKMTPAIMYINTDEELKETGEIYTITVMDK